MKIRLLVSALSCIAVASPAWAAAVTVKPGQSIQKAIDAAAEGDVISVEPGVYNEALHVDKHGITLQGVIRNGERAVLDGQGKLNDGMISSSNRFVMSGFRVQNYLGNGVTNQGGDGITLRDLVVDNTGVYGLYPVEAKNILIEYCTVLRVRDAGIYVGQSQDGIVRFNYVTQNVAGIETENSINIAVENNVAFDNVAGILTFVLPGLLKKVGADNSIRNNFIFNNNHANFADPKAIVAQVPSGTGILVLAADRTDISGNYIADNKTFGVVIADHDFITTVREADLQVDPKPDGNRITNNYFLHNGYDPIPFVKELIGKGADVTFTGRGKDNCMTGREQVTTSMAGDKLMPCPEIAGTKPAPAMGAMMHGMAGMMGSAAKASKADAKKTVAVKPAAKDTVIVLIKGMTYAPMHVTVKAGQTIRWINEDAITHTVTSGVDGATDEKPVLDSGYMEGAAIYEYTFKTKGKFVYFCLPHRTNAPMINASVTVE